MEYDVNGTVLANTLVELMGGKWKRKTGIIGCLIAGALL
jgi:hypothetical protein